MNKKPIIIAFLNVHPNTISKIRRDITFDGRNKVNSYKNNTRQFDFSGTVGT